MSKWVKIHFMGIQGTNAYLLKKTQDLLFLPVNHVTDSWGGDLQQLLLLEFCLFPLIPHLGLFWVSEFYSLTSEQQIQLNHDLVEIKSIN